MATPTLPSDFKEFLQLLNSKKVEYLLIGGYAVGYYGYVRATADMDVWIAMNPKNAGKLVEALREFGFDVSELSVDLFLSANKVIRMGNPPFRIEVLTSIDGVDFTECYTHRIVGGIDDVEVSLIGLEHLKINKRASGRGKDLADLENLP